MIVLVLVTVAVARRDGPTPLEEARILLDDDDEFAAADRSGLTLVRMSTKLQEQGEHCVDTTGEVRSRRCDAYFAAAGHVRIMSLQVLPCSRPQLFDVRVSLRAYLDELSSEPEAATLPPLPRCA